MSAHIHELKNGLKLVLLPVDSPVMHLSFMIKAGTRYEADSELGIAHFLEHMSFKGTEKRKAYHILSRLDDIGGDLNAYTTKEEICIHATFLKPYFSRAMDLVSDLVLNSTFPEKEIKKEKDVVLDEIDSYQDHPSDLIFEEFEERIFKDHPLGRNILGSPADVKKITQSQLVEYVNKNYTGVNCSMSVVGDIGESRFIKSAEKHFGQLKSGERNNSPEGSFDYTPFRTKVEKESNQVHSIIGCPVLGAKHNDIVAFSLLNNLLGGTGMNNRLNLNIREKYGYTYHLESYFHAFEERGLFGVYLGTAKSSADKSIALVKKELAKLRTVALGTLQLHKAKTQLIGQLALNRENNLARSQAFAKSILIEEELRTFEVISEEIQAVTHSDLLEVANRWLPEDQLSTLIFNAK